MSWQAYVDTSLVGSCNFDRAAIFSAAGDSKWAASPGFHVSRGELEEIIDAYKDFSKVQREGVHVAGDRYVVIHTAPRSLYGKKGKEGVCIVKTTQAILIAHYPETVIPGSAANTIEQLGDYLVGVGY